jgi:four helix bundle protein
MTQSNHDIQIRTKNFALDIIRLSDFVPNTRIGKVFCNQIVRSGTSIGAHVREGKHARSDAELFSKVSVALQELEETRYWIDLLCDGGLMRREKLSELMSEADQLTAILYTSVRTLQNRISRKT